MADTIKKNIVTDIAALKWCYIDGQGKLNFDEDGYDYTVTLALNKKQAKAFKAEVA